MPFDENNLDHIWFELSDIERRLPYGWHEQMGRVNSVRCALRDSGPMAGRLMAKRLAGIDLSAIWDILIEACKDIALYYGGSVVAGAAVGGIGGAFLGGVGAAPGAVLGAAAGAQVGGWVMGFLGLKSLVEDLGREFPKALDYYSQGFRKAWGLPRHDWGHDPHHSHMDSGDSHVGASYIAQGHVVMVIAILTALTAWLTRGKGDRTALLQEIRQSSRLGPKVADWVVQNEGKLAAHPQLQPRRNAAASEQPIMQERASKQAIMQGRPSKSGGAELNKSKPASSGRDVEAKGRVELTEGASSLIGANRAIIDQRKLTEYALNPSHPVGGNKARVFESALGFTKDNADDLMSQLRQGVMNNTPIAGKVDQFGSRFTVDIPVTGPAGSGVVRSGWIYKTGSNVPEMTTIFVK